MIISRGGIPRTEEKRTAFSLICNHNKLHNIKQCLTQEPQFWISKTFTRPKTSDIVSVGLHTV